MKFIDQIKESIENKGQTIIKAWGKAISLGVKLALQAIEEIHGLSIGHVSIGTEASVEIPVKPGKNRDIAKTIVTDQADDEIARRVTRAMSWIEIPLDKS